MCLIGQTARIAPADKRLYALRDVTATVESLPLIASSIMSKKLAEGIDGLVIDCKVGRGAFMKTVENARALCALMRAIGQRAGKRVTCVLTDMDAPIGRTIGNALEIRESIEVLRGGGPVDTRELTRVLGAEMLRARRRRATTPRPTAARGSRRRSPTAARSRCSARSSRRRAAIRACATRPAACCRKREVTATSCSLPPAGIVAIDSEALGIAALLLGAGRRTKEDAIDPSAGPRASMPTSAR